MKTSVVIPNLNSPTIDRTIASVRAQLPGVEIVVIGRDEPKKLDGLDVVFHESERVLNPAEARNRGIQFATGDFFLFIDADCEAAAVQADVIGMSALLTTTMEEQRNVAKLVKERGLPFKTVVGGAPCTQRWADQIGADAYAEDASEGVRKIDALLGKV